MTTIPPSTNKCPTPESLVGFVKGILTPEERTAIEEHFSTCEACRIATSGLIRVDQDVNPTVSEVAVGGSIDRYEIEERVGSGTSGIVYRAFDPKLKRTIALKVIVSQEDEAIDVIVRERAIREAQAIARISHPNVVNVFDVGTWEGQVFLAMEWVDGTNLAEWLEDHHPNPSELARIFSECARGLQAAHDADVLHRDFKPDNVLVGLDKRVRVTDFGLAHLGLSGQVPLSLSDDVENPRITHTNGIMGTPAYMAPEQYTDATIDRYTEQFALCVSLWEAIHGIRPFDATNMEERNAAIRSGKLPAHQTPRGMAKLARIAIRGMAASPSDRYTSMAELAERLSPKRKGSQLGWLGGGLFVASLAAIASVVLLRPGDKANESIACSTFAEQADLVWTPQIRKTLKSHFLKNIPDTGATLFESFVTKIDTYVKGWKIARVRACETRVEHPSAHRHLQELCLDRRLRDSESLLALLAATSSGERLAQGINLVGRLESLTTCSGENPIHSPLPSPHIAPEVERLRSVLLTAAKAAIIDEHKLAASYLESVKADIQELAHLPLVAELAYFTAFVAYRRTDSPLLRKEFETAGKLAEQADHDYLRARVLIQLATNFSSTYKEGQTYAELSIAIASRLQDKLLEVEAKITLAGIHGAYGHDEKMQEMNESALATVEAMGDAGRPHLAEMLTRVTWGEPDLSKQETYIRRAIKILRDDSKQSPQLAATITSLGILMYEQGKLDDAVSTLGEGIEMYRLYDDEVGVGQASMFVCIVLRDKLEKTRPNPDLELLEEGETACKTSVSSAEAFLEEGGPREHRHLASTYQAFSRLYSSAGQSKKALVYIEKAVALRTGLEGTPMELAEMQVDYGSTLVDVGNDYEKALEYFYLASDVYMKSASEESKADLQEFIRDAKNKAQLKRGPR